MRIIAIFLDCGQQSMLAYLGGNMLVDSLLGIYIPLELVHNCCPDFESLSALKQTCKHNDTTLSKEYITALFHKKIMFIPYKYVQETMSYDEWLTHMKITIESFDKAPNYFQEIIDSWKKNLSPYPLVVFSGSLQDHPSVMVKHNRKKKTIDSAIRRKLNFDRFTRSQPIQDRSATIYVKNLNDTDLEEINQNTAYWMGTMRLSSEDSEEDLNARVRSKTVPKLSFSNNKKVSVIYTPGSKSKRQQISPRSIENLMRGNMQSLLHKRQEETKN